MQYSFVSEPDEKTKEEFKSFSELSQKLFVSRGIETHEEAANFLNPSYDEHMHDPFLFKDIEKACERILKAINDNEKTIIYSDYDTDGIPGAVILHDFLKQIGYENFENYIPHRNLEGFGLNTKAVKELAEGGANLIITIDCGISDVAEVALANELGVDVIITDHHLPPKSFRKAKRSGDPASQDLAIEVLPQAVAIVNHKQETCEYPFKELCGAGVVYKLVQALIKKGEFELVPGWEKWLLDMAGIATVSDMVPLVGENRIFAHYGLLVLRKSPRPGILTLLSKTRTSQKHLDEVDIGFTIGPRINAASRMDEPILAFDLLSTQDNLEAGTLFEKLDHLNNERKGHVANIVKKVKKKLSEKNDLPHVICTGHPDWKPGLLGLACNTIAEEFSRPVFLWGREGGKTLKGSCRSDGSASVVKLMHAVPDNTFIDYGGHEMSGGFSVTDNAVHTLEEKLCEVYPEISNGHSKESDPITHKLSVLDITWSLFDEVNRFAPFGVGNPRPLFLIDKARIKSASNFGKAKNHLKIMLTDEDGFANVEAICFFKTMDTFDVSLEEGEKVSIVGHLEKSTFGYKPTLRIRIIDILS